MGLRLKGAGAVLAGACLAACAAGAPAPSARQATAPARAHSAGEVEVLASGRPEPAAPHAHRAPVHHPAHQAASAPTTMTAKGVSAWAFSGVNQALARSGASWYYTWAVNHSGIDGPAGVQFVPMIWGAASVTTANLSQAKQEGPDLLGFNEPDNSGQANMTVSQALHLWPKLMSTGLTLGSPAVASGAATPGGWLDQFMSGAKARGYRVNFITVHWYGADFVTSQAVQQLRSYLQAIHARYGLPIWLTEFALIKFGPTTFPTAHQQAAFVTAATSMLSRLPYLQRYAWFALPATSGDGTAGLFRPGAAATAAGRAFEAAGGG